MTKLLDMADLLVYRFRQAEYRERLVGVDERPAVSFHRKVGLIVGVMKVGQLSKGLFVVVQLRERDRMRDLLKEQGLPFDLEQGRSVEPA